VANPNDTKVISPSRAAIFARISRDGVGEAKGVARQEADGRDRCSREGWDVTAVVVENDLSATKHARRKLFYRMLDDLGSRYDVIVVSELERLQRDMVGYAPLYERAEKAKAKIAYGDNAVVDFTSGDGRLSNLRAITPTNSRGAPRGICQTPPHLGQWPRKQRPKIARR